MCTSVNFFTLEKGGVCRGPGPGSQKKGALLNLRDAEEGPLELGFVLGGERESRARGSVDKAKPLCGTSVL